MFGDPPRIVADFRALAVLALGHEARFLEQRKVDVAFDVARRAGIAVPVPSAAEFGALLDDPDIRDAAVAQPGAGEQSAEPAADDQRLDLVAQRYAIDRGLDVGIVEIVRELAGHLDILLVAVGAQALVALFAVLRPQGRRVETQFFRHRLVVDGLMVDAHARSSFSIGMIVRKAAAGASLIVQPIAR